MTKVLPRGFAMLLVLGILLAIPDVAHADEHRLELELGGGFAATRSSSPPPHLAVLDAGIVVWLSERWGLSWSGSYGPGEQKNPAQQRLPFPQHGGDRLFIAANDLFFHRATVRYRRRLPVPGSLTFQVGGGLLLKAAYDDATLFAETTSSVVAREFRNEWSGLSTEVLVSKRISSRYAVKAGLLIDTAFDIWYYQPIMLFAVGL